MRKQPFLRKFAFLFMQKSKTIAFLINQGKNALVFTTLLVYLMGSISFESLHKLFVNHSHTQAHTPQQEENPCHIALFHQERAGGCEHPTHFIEIDNCTLCDHSLPVLAALLSESVADSFHSFQSYSFALTPLTKAGITLYVAGRAPPLA